MLAVTGIWQDLFALHLSADGDSSYNCIQLMTERPLHLYMCMHCINRLIKYAVLNESST